MSCVGGKIRWVVVGHIDGYALFSGCIGREIPLCPPLRRLSRIDYFSLDMISPFESFEMEVIYFPYHPFQLVFYVHQAVISFVYFLSFMLLRIITQV